MTTAVIVGVLLLLALGLVASQLFRLKDWLNRQPPVESTMPAAQRAEEEREMPGRAEKPESGEEISGPGPHAT